MYLKYTDCILYKNMYLQRFLNCFFETYTCLRRKMKSEKLQGFFKFLQEETVYSRLCIIKNAKRIKRKVIKKQFHNMRGKREMYGFPKRRNKAFFQDSFIFSSRSRGAGKVETIQKFPVQLEKSDAKIRENECG